MLIDPQTIQQLMVTAVFAVPLITGLVEVIKRMFPSVNPRFTPAISVLIGIIVGLLAIELSVLGAVVGLIFGLSGVGLWEASKTTIMNK